VTVVPVGEDVEVTVTGPPDTAALDVIRALCAAAWSVTDHAPDAERARLLGAIARHPAVAPLGCGRASAQGPGR
jgi:hypothetical protein